MLRTHAILLLLMVLLLPTVSPAQKKNADETEEPLPTTARISYNPEQTDIFKNLDNMKVEYVSNFWNTRRGTRLALRENILRPDTSRVMTAPLVKKESGWEAELHIPPTAALLSYYITDGEAIDDNNGETFTAFVFTSEGVPVPNAHYFMVPFLELAGASLEERLRESEKEIQLYPKNFRAYTQYFGLYTEIERGSERVQMRIIQRLNKLEEQYGDDDDCLNLIARTYYYILRDQEKGLAYKSRIPQRARWAEVEAMFDAQEHDREQRDRALERERTRAALLNTEVPDIDFLIGDDRIDVKSLQGAPVVLVFWASTSDLSVELLAKLVDVKKKYADRGVKILTINAGEDQGKVDSFKSRYNYPFIWARNNGIALLAYGVSGVPQTYVIDQKSIVRDIVIGYEPGSVQKISSAIEKVLQ